MKNRIMIIAALILGAASVAAVASCLPDEPGQATDTPAAVVTDEYPGMDDGTLACGEHAKPATDYAPVSEGGMGWWAYCEPALMDEPATPPASTPGGDVDPASIAQALGTACPTEDSENCFWDASRNGNGQGASFVTVEGHIFPLDDVYAGH